MKTKIGIVDDHQLFLKSLALMLESFRNYDVVIEACNGKDLQNKLGTAVELPEILLVDVNMPVMNGIETVEWLSKNYPAIKVVALSMNDNDKTILNMIKAGCCSYMLKDTHPDELEKALNEIKINGYYNGDASNISFRRMMMLEKESEQIKISEREQIFLQLACSDKTYKEIAEEMGLSERTIDKYREDLFKKLKVQSRVGLALEAIRKELVSL